MKQYFLLSWVFFFLSLPFTLTQNSNSKASTDYIKRLKKIEKNIEKAINNLKLIKRQKIKLDVVLNHRYTLKGVLGILSSKKYSKLIKFFNLKIPPYGKKVEYFSRDEKHAFFHMSYFNRKKNSKDTFIFLSFEKEDRNGWYEISPQNFKDFFKKNPNQKRKYGLESINYYLDNISEQYLDFLKFVPTNFIKKFTTGDWKYKKYSQKELESRNY